MKQALIEAQKALEKDEVPVGAIIVFEENIIARAHNQRETLNDPTAHAEIIAITQAASYLESRQVEPQGNLQARRKAGWRLSGCTMFSTIEPCPMCAGAIVLARIDRLVFGTLDEKAGACGSLYNIVQDDRLNHQVSVTKGVLEEECREIIQKFFLEKRNGKV